MKDSTQKKYTKLVFDNLEMGIKHNPYDQEFREQSSIENGDIEQFEKSIAEQYDGQLGILAEDELRNGKNMCIVLLAISCRSAIRGGLSSEIAFSLCDSYIRQIEQMNDTKEIADLAREAQYQYIEMVHTIKKRKTNIGNYENPYIKKCKNYITLHLHEKISTKEIAQDLHINPNYLSSLFKKNEGITITQYILNEKMTLAKNMLIYSEHSYIEIATYLGFSSQSHLGVHFKEITGYTLKEYRDQFGKL